MTNEKHIDKLNRHERDLLTLIRTASDTARAMRVVTEILVEYTTDKNFADKLKRIGADDENAMRELLKGIEAKIEVKSGQTPSVNDRKA